MGEGRASAERHIRGGDGATGQAVALLLWGSRQIYRGGGSTREMRMVSPAAGASLTPTGILAPDLAGFLAGFLVDKIYRHPPPFFGTAHSKGVCYDSGRATE